MQVNIKIISFITFLIAFINNSKASTGKDNNVRVKSLGKPNQGCVNPHLNVEIPGNAPKRLGSFNSGSPTIGKSKGTPF